MWEHYWSGAKAELMLHLLAGKYQALEWEVFSQQSENYFNLKTKNTVLVKILPKNDLFQFESSPILKFIPVPILQGNISIWNLTTDYKAHTSAISPNPNLVGKESWDCFCQAHSAQV